MANQTQAEAQILPELNKFLESIGMTRSSQDSIYNTITILESKEFRTFRIRGYFRDTSKRPNIYAVKEVTPDRSSGETSGMNLEGLLEEIQILLVHY
jgi:hypothetical protein